MNAARRDWRLVAGVVGEGAVWVLLDQGTLLRVDPALAG